MKWCLMRNSDLGAETIVVESIKSQVLHFDDRQGKVPILKYIASHNSSDQF